MKIFNKVIDEKYLYVILSILCLAKYFYAGSFFIWFDELHTIMFSESINETWQDSHLPFHYFLVYLSRSYFSFLDINWQIRIPSIVASILLFIITFVYARNNKDKREYFIYFILINLWPTEWSLIREARVYGLVFVFSALTILLQNNYFEAPNYKKLIWMLISIILGAITNILFIPFYFAIFISQTMRKNLNKSQIVPVLICILISLIPGLYFYFINNMLGHSVAVTSWVPTPSWRSVYDFLLVFLGKKHPFFGVHYIVPILFSLISMIWLVKSRSFSLKKTLISIPVIFLIGLIILFPYINFLYARYFYFIIPAILLSFAKFLKKYNNTHVLLIIFLLFSYNIFILQIFNVQTSPPGLKSFIARSKDNKSLNVICGTEGMDKYFLDVNEINPKKYANCSRLTSEEITKHEEINLYRYYFIHDVSSHPFFQTLRAKYKRISFKGDLRLGGVFLTFRKIK